MWAKTVREKPQPETEMETKPEMELEKDSGTYVLMPETTPAHKSLSHLCNMHESRTTNGSNSSWQPKYLPRP